MPAHDPNAVLRALAPAWEAAQKQIAARKLVKPPMDLIEDILVKFQAAALEQVAEHVKALTDRAESTERDALERAAKVCEGLCDEERSAVSAWSSKGAPVSAQYAGIRANMATTCAAAIRALASGQGGEGKNG